jgi:hypothetical protein
MDRYFAVITAPDSTMFAGLRDRGAGWACFPLRRRRGGAAVGDEGLLTLTSSLGSARRAIRSPYRSGRAWTGARQTADLEAWRQLIGSGTASKCCWVQTSSGTPRPIAGLVKALTRSIGDSRCWCSAGGGPNSRNKPAQSRPGTPSPPSTGHHVQRGSRRTELAAAPGGGDRGDGAPTAGGGGAQPG